MSENRLTVRPLFMFSAAFFITGILSLDFSSKVTVCLGIFSFVTLLTCFLPFVRKQLKQILTPSILGILFALILIFFSVNAEKNAAAKLIGRSENCDVQVTSVVGTTSSFGSYYGTVTSDGAADGLNVSFSISDGSLKPGDTLNCVATFEEVPLDEASRLSAERVFLKCSVTDVSFIGENRRFSLTQTFGAINSRLSVRLKLNGGGELSRSVLLGNRDDLDLSVKRDFSRLGISHLLAVSGLHLSLLVVLSEKLLLKLNVSKSKRCLIRFPLILIYMGITGFTPSIMRAGIMHLIKVVGDLINRKSDGLTSLGIAVTLITVIDPYSFYDLGLILSAISAFACITFGMIKSSHQTKFYRNAFTKLLGKALETVQLTIWICALTLPVTCAYFRNVSLISPLTNVIYIPAVTVLLYLSLFHLLFCKIPFVSAASTFLLSLTEDIITSGASKISHIPNITVPVNERIIFLLSLLLFVSLASYPFVKGKFQFSLKMSAVASTVIISVVIITMTVTQARSAEVLYVTHSKNEGFILRDGLTFTLIDISDGSKNMSYEMYLQASDAKATEIDTLILTHLHSKHIASVDELTDRIIVRQLLLPESKTDGDIDVSEKLLEMCQKKSIDAETYKRESGDVFSDENVNVKFHNYVKLSRSTHPVVTFDFTIDGNQYAYGGGSRNESEDFLNVTPKCDAVFIGNHHPKTKDFTLSDISHAVVSFGEDSDELRKALENCEEVTYLKENSIFKVKIPQE